MGVFMRLSTFVFLFSQLFSLLFSPLTFANPNHNPNPALLGQWHAENVITGRGVQFRLAFEFTEHHMNLNVNCYFQDGAYLQSATSSYVQYRGTDIVIRDYNENVANDGYRYCSASLKPSVWTTHFDSHGRLVLYAPAPYQTRLFLVRTDHANLAH